MDGWSEGERAKNGRAGGGEFTFGGPLRQYHAKRVLDLRVG